MCTVKEKLVARGVPYGEVMERFVNDEAFYFDYLHQFTQDEEINLLEQALQDGDIDNAFKAAHTLKGLMGNLGLVSLVTSITPLVEVLRRNSLEGGKELFTAFQGAYQEYCNFIIENIPTNAEPSL